MKESEKIALIKILEGFCSINVIKIPIEENPCKNCIFNGCKACKKERIGSKDTKELKDIKRILISKKLLTNN